MHYEAINTEPQAQLGQTHQGVGTIQPQVLRADIVTTTDFVIGTMSALAMGTIFTLLSSGLSLIVTFVPGVVLSWLLYGWLFVKKIPLPASTTFLPPFFVLLAIQFIHFAEEFATGFSTKFPALYSGVPYSESLFVSFNMISYAIYAVGCILALTKHIRFLLMPPLVFIIYGAIGNAIAHTWWSLYLQSYFPGLFTAQLFWIAGPLVLYKVVGQRMVVFTTIILFTLVLVPLLTLFAR
jgi:hypothetical protein